MTRKTEFWIYQERRDCEPWAIHVFAERKGRAKWYSCNFAFYAEWLNNKSQCVNVENVKIMKNDIRAFIDVVKLICDTHGRELTDRDKAQINHELVFMMGNL